MARQLSNDPGETNEIRVPVSAILADQAKNSRRFMPEAKYITNLSRDLTVRGQMIPVLVRDLTDEEKTAQNGSSNGEIKYVLVDGYCRYAAITLANENGGGMDILVRVISPGTDPESVNLESFKISTAANNPNLRRAPSLIDLAYQITEFSKSGMSGKEVAEEMGISRGLVSQLHKLPDLRPDIQKRIHAGEIPLHVARILPDQTEEEQDATITDIDKAKASGESTKAVVERNRKVKRVGKKKVDRTAVANGVSAKTALKTFEELCADPVEDPETGKAPKETKAQETRRLVFGLMWKFMAGKLGQQALVNQVGKVLGC